MRSATFYYKFHAAFYRIFINEITLLENVIFHTLELFYSLVIGKTRRFNRNLPETKKKDIKINYIVLRFIKLLI